MKIQRPWALSREGDLWSTDPGIGYQKPQKKYYMELFSGKLYETMSIRNKKNLIP